MVNDLGLDEMTIKRVSPAGSLKGYKFKTWLVKNKETLKMLVAAGVGITLFFLPQVPDVAMSSAIGAAGATATKLAADTFDFFVSEVELK